MFNFAEKSLEKKANTFLLFANQVSHRRIPIDLEEAGGYDTPS